MWINIFVLLLGYLIGSISPAFILGKILKGIDIRKVGTKNAGATNVKHILGIGPAVITAVFDMSKGLLVMLIAWQVFHLPLPWIYASGFCAILGHTFPFYLKFRGGEGSATAVAMVLYLFILFIWKGQLGLTPFLIIALFALSLLFISQQGEIVGLFTIPFFAYLIYKEIGSNIQTIFLDCLLGWHFVVIIIHIIKDRLFQTTGENKEKILHWRTLARPAAIVFPLLYFYFGKTIPLYLAGSVALVFLIFDGIRLWHSGINLFLFQNVKKLLKEKEKAHFSSMTMFTVSAFLSILIFDKSIAILVLFFLIFGDLFAKILGILYGRRRFFDKTLEGTLAFFTFSLVAGYILSPILGLSFLIYFVGALTASITEALPWGIDDNLSTAVISGGFMTGARILFG